MKVKQKQPPTIYSTDENKGPNDSNPEAEQTLTISSGSGNMAPNKQSTPVPSQNNHNREIGN